MATPKRNFIGAMATAVIGCLAALACAGTSPALAGNDSTPETRWRIADGGKRIVWDVAHDARLPHGDRFEMSGLRASLIFSYGVVDDSDTRIVESGN